MSVVLWRMVCGTELPLVFETAGLVLANEGVPAPRSAPTPEDDMLADKMNYLCMKFMVRMDTSGG